MKTMNLAVISMVVAVMSSAALAAPVLFAGDYTENFDSMGTAGTAFPAGFSVLTLAGVSGTTTLPTSTQLTAATAGSTTLAVWNQTSGAVTWGNQAGNVGASSADTDRLLATSPTGTWGSILQLDLTNNTGNPLAQVRLAYDMKALKDGTRKSGRTETAEELPGFRFYFLDGSTWTRLTGLDLANDTLNSVGHAASVINFTAPVAVGGSMSFRWFDDNGDPFSPDYMVAIDNVVITPEPSTLVLLALSAAGVIRRRSH
jgi:hypothetical protein